MSLSKIKQSKSQNLTEGTIDLDIMKDENQLKELIKKNINKTQLGQGSFGKVYYCEYKDNSKCYNLAFKILNNNKIDEVKKEEEILIKIQARCSEYFLCYYKTINIDGLHYFVTEYLDFTLEKFLENEKYKQNEQILNDIIIKRLMDGIKILHDEFNILHLDIKPENIMIQLPNNPDNIQDIKVKYIDFGLSCIMNETHICEYEGVRGSPVFIHPKMTYTRCDNSCDYFALLVTYFYMVYKMYPYEAILKYDKEIVKIVLEIKNDMKTEDGKKKFILSVNNIYPTIIQFIIPLYFDSVLDKNFTDLIELTKPETYYVPYDTNGHFLHYGYYNNEYRKLPDTKLGDFYNKRLYFYRIMTELQDKYIEKQSVNRPTKIQKKNDEKVNYSYFIPKINSKETQDKFVEFKKKEQVGISFHTSIYNGSFNQQYQNIYKYQNGNEFTYFNLKPKTEYIGYIENNKLIVVNLKDTEFEKSFEDNINDIGINTIFINNLKTLKLQLQTKRHFPIEKFNNFSFLPNFPQKLNTIDIEGARKKVNDLNRRLNCNDFKIELNYVYELANGSEVNVFSSNYNSKSLLLCVFNNKKCVSSLNIKMNDNTNNISYDSFTKTEFENKKFNKLLTAVLILIAKDLKGTFKNIVATAENTTSAYLAIKYFNAKPMFNKDFKDSKLEDFYDDKYEVSYKKIKNYITDITDKGQALDYKINLNDSISIEKANLVFDKTVEDIHKSTLCDKKGGKSRSRKNRRVRQKTIKTRK